MRLWALAAITVLQAVAQTAASVRMIEVDGEGARYWPRWRGPSGQGLVTGSGYPDRWSATEQVLWKTAIPGRGNSSPIVWGDRIFLTAASEDGSRRSIVCFGRSDGKLMWETSAPTAPAEKLYWKNTYASSTPVTDGERVYAYFGNAGVLAVSMEGRQVWHSSLGPITLYHGSAGSPALYKNSLILFQDQKQDSFVVALDRRTGAVHWKTPRAERVGWGSPIVIRAGTRDELIISSQHRVIAYDPGSGKELWRAEGTTDEVTPTPAVGHGLVFCPSGRAGPTLAIRPGGSGDVTATHVAWQTAKGSPFIPSPLVDGDYLYLVNDMTSIATCYEARSGKLAWQGRLGQAAREGFSASPVAVDGKIFFTNDEGDTFVLKAGGEFQLLGVNSLGERVLASPALVDRRWYFRTEKHLLAIGQ